MTTRGVEFERKSNRNKEEDNRTIKKNPPNKQKVNIFTILVRYLGAINAQLLVGVDGNKDVAEKRL